MFTQSSQDSEEEMDEELAENLRQGKDELGEPLNGFDDEAENQ
jgi:hypothetical protein